MTTAGLCCPKAHLWGRREFGKTVAGGLVGAMAAASAEAAAPVADAAAPWNMRLSTSSIHYLHLRVEEACARIAELGFDAVDIWSAHEGCPHLDDVLDRLGPSGLQGILQKHGLRLFAFSVYSGGYPRYAELLGRAGGGVAVRGSAGPCAPGELSARMRAFFAGLQPEIELAAKYDSYLAIENHGHALLDSLDSFQAFVDLNQSPRLGIALAPYHLQRIGVSVPEAIAVAGRQLLFFYAWQMAEGVAQLPGHGPTDFTPWIAALAKAEYRGCVNPFMHGDVAPDVMSAALAKSRDYLKECHARATAAGVAG